MEIKDNYIIAEIKILKENINKDVRIINTFEQFKREEELEDDENDYIYENEKEIKKYCKIKINEKFIPFNYFYKFNKIGIYKIQYIFNNCITNTNYLFFKCSLLTKIDLSNFNTQEVTNMMCMFEECSSLVNINLSNINTQKVKNMSCMFSECSSLINLDLSSFNTKSLSYMDQLFYECSSLIEVNLSSFDYLKYIDMEEMFYGCISLTHLINYNVRQFYDNDDLLYNCSSLIKKENKIKVFIYRSFWPTIEHYFDCTTSCEGIKKYINELTDIPIDKQRLITSGKQLCDEEMLKDYIRKDRYPYKKEFTQEVCVIHLFFKEVNKKEIKIKIEEDNKIRKIVIDEFMSIYEIKALIFEFEKISPDNLLYNGEILEDYKTGFTLNDNSVLNLSKKNQKFIKINLYNIDKEDYFITLLVSPFEKNESIENKIIEKENLQNSENQSIYILPQEKNYLENGDKLRYIIINRFHKKNPNDINIGIQTLKKKYEIHVKQSDKIGKIKDIIFPFYSPKSLSVIHNSTKLEDDNTFEDYKIVNDDTFSLAQKLIGG